MNMTYSLNSTVEIAPGVHMPRLGFGVYQSPKAVCKQSASTALEVGYRHIDCAGGYYNEAEVGAAVNDVRAKIPREEIFVTTKIYDALDGIVMEPTKLHDPAVTQAVYNAVVKGVEKFSLERVDLFLIHTPDIQGPDGRQVLWQALEKLLEEGKTRAIGVSNFGVKHLKQLKAYAKVTPAVNQIEIHPWCQRKEIVAYCQQEGITLEAYCPIVRAEKNDHLTIVKLSQKYAVEPAQVLIRWSLQKGYVPLPKSDTPSRIKSNSEVYGFEISKEDMDELDSLQEGTSAPIAWNPVDCV